MPVHPQALAASAEPFALALRGAAARSADDEQSTDPFGQGDTPAQQEPAPEQPVEQASGPTKPAPCGNRTAEDAPTAEAAQKGSPTLPRTGVPVLLFGAIGYALLLAGIAIRRQA